MRKFIERSVCKYYTYVYRVHISPRSATAGDKNTKTRGQKTRNRLRLLARWNINKTILRTLYQ
jgi:hypothetical protein